jgi:hypothetical protein
MIFGAVLGLSLIVNTAFDSGMNQSAGVTGVSPESHLSQVQKDNAIRPLVRDATECIAHSVSADPRFREWSRSGHVNDLIVDSMPSCIKPVRVMIDAYDRLFGTGQGQAFFMGPYLDTLPAMVDTLVKGDGAPDRR